jgi:hypothetical protein
MKPKKCKTCKKSFCPTYSTTQNTCSVQCAIQLANEKKSDDWKKRKAKLKSELMTLPDHLKIAQMVFNKYIRLRDQGKECISCGQPPKKANAGHYFSQGGHSNVRFDEDNVHVQCEHCNSFLSGNLLNYQIGIEKRIGGEKLIELHSRAHEIKKWTVQELKEIAAKYRDKIKNI